MGEITIIVKSGTIVIIEINIEVAWILYVI